MALAAVLAAAGWADSLAADGRPARLPVRGELPGVRWVVVIDRWSCGVVRVRSVDLDAVGALGEPAASRWPPSALSNGNCWASGRPTGPAPLLGVVAVDDHTTPRVAYVTMAMVSDELLAAVEGLAATVQRESARRWVAGRIKRTPGVSGGDACVRDTRIPVWTLIGLQKQGRTEAELAADFPSLTPADMDAVWAYYRDHSAEIDAAIADEEREA